MEVFGGLYTDIGHVPFNFDQFKPPRVKKSRVRLAD